MLCESEPSGIPPSSGHRQQEPAGANEMLFISDTLPHLRGSHPSPGHHPHQWITASLRNSPPGYQHQFSPVWPPHPVRAQFLKIWLCQPLGYKNIFTCILKRISCHCNWNKTHAFIMATSLACGPSFPSPVAVAHSTPATMSALLVFSSWQLLCSLPPPDLCTICGLCHKCTQFCSSPSCVQFVLEVLSEPDFLRDPFPSTPADLTD